MKKYTHLTHEDRVLIYELLRSGKSQKEIADKLQVHKSTIGREVKRNSGRKGYRPHQAEEIAQKRKVTARTKN